MEVRGPSIRLASVAIFEPMQRWRRQPEPPSVLSKRFFSDFRKIFRNFATQFPEKSSRGNIFHAKFSQNMLKTFQFPKIFGSFTPEIPEKNNEWK